MKKLKSLFTPRSRKNKECKAAAPQSASISELAITSEGSTPTADVKPKADAKCE